MSADVLRDGASPDFTLSHKLPVHHVQLQLVDAFGSTNKVYFESKQPENRKSLLKTLLSE